MTSLKKHKTEIQQFLFVEVSKLLTLGYTCGELQFINHFIGSKRLKSLSPTKYFLHTLLTQVLDRKMDEKLASKPSSYNEETLILPYSHSLKATNFRPILGRARRAIPPNLRHRLKIAVTLNYPLPIGFLLSNNSFGKMPLKQKQEDEIICFCANKNKF